jgi:hypothetical protein
MPCTRYSCDPLPTSTTSATTSPAATNETFVAFLNSTWSLFESAVTPAQTGFSRSDNDDDENKPSTHGFQSVIGYGLAFFFLLIIGALILVLIFYF